MSYNGSGTFQINTSGQPVVTGTVISSSAFNALTADLATGLSTAITKDGQTTTTARIPFAQGINSSLATDTTNGSSGSIYTAGGIGITKGLFVGGTATFSATPVFSALTASSAVATDASKNLVSVTNTGTGNNVLATSPTLVTPVLGAASATSVTVNAGTAAAPAITTSGDTNTGIFFPTAETIAFSNDGVESMRIDSGRCVGINTSINNVFDQSGVQRALVVQRVDPSTTLNGSTAAIVITNGDTTTNNTAQLNFAAITGASANQYSSAIIACTFGARTNAQYPTGILTFSTSTSLNSAPSEKMRIANDGTVTMLAYGAGAATFSAAGVISSVSDETWKVKDGVPVDPDSMLKKLEPGYWYYNNEKKETFGTDRQLGFYAQNVNAAIGPEAAPEPSSYTNRDSDGNETTTKRPWGYYDRSVLAVTVLSLQKALATIESLTARITALEAK
jgi:hypothetical protein